MGLLVCVCVRARVCVPDTRPTSPQRGIQVNSKVLAIPNIAMALRLRNMMTPGTGQQLMVSTGFFLAHLSSKNLQQPQIPDKYKVCTESKV